MISSCVEGTVKMFLMDIRSRINESHKTDA